LNEKDPMRGSVNVKMGLLLEAWVLFGEKDVS
jgi:hypothetical protein